MTLLAPKHRNIGSTVSMVKDIHNISKNPRMAKALTKLFMAESLECDWQSPNKHCLFNSDPKHYQLHTGPGPCRIGNCPLGPLVDKELEFGTNPDRLQLYGKNTMKFGTRTPGGHIHIGYTGWRKYWNMFKKNLLHGWIDWLKEWPSYLRKHWKLNLFVVAGVFAVYYGSALAGYIAGTYF